MAQRAASQGGGQAPGQGDPTVQFIMMQFQEISQRMMKMMQGMATKAPQLVDLMTKLAGGFKEVEQQFQQSMQQGQGAQPAQPGSEPTQQSSEDPSAVAA